jgi:glycosyltransferase involved in cell wall biosynthesis
MRLAYLSNAKIPSREANSIHVMKMCQALGQLGHEVTLLAPDVQAGLEADVGDPYCFYGVEACFRLEKLPWRAFKGRGWIYGFEAGRLASRLGVDAAFGRCLHACSVAARLGVPTSWDAHMPTFLQRRTERWLFRWMIDAPAFRMMMTNCDALRCAVLADFPELADRIVAAHNGADALPEDIEPADLGATDDRPHIGYVGHLYAGKGFELIRELAARAPWAVFHVVGGEQHTLDAVRGDPTLPSNIRLHGFVPPFEAERLILAFDVLLAPYQAEVKIAGGGETAAWMSPLKLFAYMAAGRPILCSDLPVLREIIQDGRNGLLVSANDAEAWAEALRRLMMNHVERERLGANAHADFVARHTWCQRARRAVESLALATDADGARRFDRTHVCRNQT